MKKIQFIIISLILCAFLSGCFSPYPYNSGPTKMFVGKTTTGFGILGLNISGFEWYLDGELLTGQILPVYLYIPGTSDIGTRELTVKFYQDGVSQSWSWEINVAEPPKSLSENTEEPLDGE